MRMHLLTAAFLLTIPTAIYAQKPNALPAAPNTPTIEAQEQSERASQLNRPIQEYVAQDPFSQGPDQPGAAAEDVGPLIVFSQQDPKAIDEMAEDLRILGFIVNRNLENALGEQRPEIRMGVPLLLESGGRRIHASYIEGFGVLFNLRLGIPLVAPPTAAPKSEHPEGPSEWDKARAALYGGDASAQQQWAEISVRRAEHYDAKLIDILKKQVMESIKSASNLRHVKPDEWIVVTVAGAPNEADNQQDAIIFPVGSNPVHLTSRPRDGSDRPTMMTFRVKKSAVDALAAKSSSGEQFAGKVEVTSYLGAEVFSRAGSGGKGRTIGR